MGTHLHTNISNIIKLLFGHEDNRLKKEAIDIVKENALLGGAPDGFYYQGILYSDISGRIGTNRGKSGSLKMSLVPVMEAYLRDFKMINADKQIIRQALVMLLARCQTMQDYRNALPECVVMLMPDLSMLPRTQETAYTIQDKPRAKRDYEKALPKIEFYCGSRLLY